MVDKKNRSLLRLSFLGVKRKPNTSVKKSSKKFKKKAINDSNILDVLTLTNSDFFAKLEQESFPQELKILIDSYFFRLCVDYLGAKNVNNPEKTNSEALKDVFKPNTLSYFILKPTGIDFSYFDGTSSEKMPNVSSEMIFYLGLKKYNNIPILATKALVGLLSKQAKEYKKDNLSDPSVNQIANFQIAFSSLKEINEEKYETCRTDGRILIDFLDKCNDESLKKDISGAIQLLSHKNSLQDSLEIDVKDESWLDTAVGFIKNIFSSCLVISDTESEKKTSSSKYKAGVSAKVSKVGGVKSSNPTSEDKINPTISGRRGDS
ncbi:MAG: hypothetical protein VX335_01395 [Pseudomonadota bacterium]|nr:hypothetical protein [Pseudomonadota bacterium]